jgi:hypothetical protein
MLFAVHIRSTCNRRTDVNIEFNLLHNKQYSKNIFNFQSQDPIVQPVKTVKIVYQQIALSANEIAHLSTLLSTKAPPTIDTLYSRQSLLSSINIPHQHQRFVSKNTRDVPGTARHPKYGLSASYLMLFAVHILSDSNCRPDGNIEFNLLHKKQSSKNIFSSRSRDPIV